MHIARLALQALAPSKICSALVSSPSCSLCAGARSVRSLLTLARRICHGLTLFALPPRSASSTSGQRQRGAIIARGASVAPSASDRHARASGVDFQWALGTHAQLVMGRRHQAAQLLRSSRATHSSALCMHSLCMHFTARALRRLSLFLRSLCLTRAPLSCTLGSALLAARRCARRSRCS